MNHADTYGWKCLTKQHSQCPGTLSGGRQCACEHHKEEQK